MECTKYQETSEFQKMNATMTLEEYKMIFYLDYIYRLIARFVGLIVTIPLLCFLLNGIIPY
ncbi:MAG: COX15/CtaA family protein [Anaerolineales bacterium]|nr:COX15/CtaA family protein [Anaerolineales bacterium]